MSKFDFDGFGEVVQGKIIAVPDYQRDYSWGKAETDALFEDIDSLYKESKSGRDGTHFIGTVVLV